MAYPSNSKPLKISVFYALSEFRKACAQKEKGQETGVTTKCNQRLETRAQYAELVFFLACIVHQLRILSGSASAEKCTGSLVCSVIFSTRVEIPVLMGALLKYSELNKSC